MYRNLAALLICATVALAQTNRGGISGTVTDSSGAIVPGATVIITNVGTNETKRLTNSEAGTYTATSLDPVTYRIEVEAAGFKKAVVEQVKVDTATTATVNVTLQTGNVKTEVNVTAQAPLINAESGTSGQTITERQIVEMPLNNRSVLDLALTVGGVTGVAGTEDPELGSGEIPAPGFNISVNGGRAGSTAILADGAGNTGVGLGRAVVTFSPDTVQEFTVQRSNFSAEFGQTGGGVINMTTKSGKNGLEGLLYWYHRNPALDAAPFTIDTNNRPQSNRRQQQFGLIFSGPVLIPRLYDGHQRTFFFAAFEPRYYYDGSPFNQLLPTDAMLHGDFSNVVQVNGPPGGPPGYTTRDIANQFGLQTQIRDATLYNQFVPVGNQFQRGTVGSNGLFPVFLNNVIPANMLDPLSQSLMKYMPKAGDYFLANGILQNYASTSFIKNIEKRLTVRVDHQINANNRLTGRYTQVPIRGDRGRGDFQIGRDEINSGGTDYSWSKQFLLSDTQTISSSMINELRLNYTYGRFTRNLPPMFDALRGRNFSTELGLPSITPGGLPDFVTGGAEVGFSQSQQNENAEHSYEIADNVSWVRGNRTWKFGVDLLQQRLKTIPLFGASGGRYEFNRNRTLTNSNGSSTSSGTGGIEFAQFLLGVYNQATLREVLIPYYYEWNSAGFYVQNDWKARPNLTLNFGLRYSLELPRTEKYDHQGVYLPELAKSFPITQPCQQFSPLLPPCTLPNGQVVTSALVPPFGFSGRGGRSRYIFPVEKLNFEPRFGFAWTPRLLGLNRTRDALVVRGGYGLSHAPLTGMGRGPSPDFSSGTSTFGTFDTRLQDPNFLPRMCCNKPVLTAISPDDFLNIPPDGLVYLNSINLVGAANALSSNSHVPYMQSWSVSLAYELTPNTVVETSYNGSKGTHLFLAPNNLNQVPFDLSQSFVASGLDPVRPPENDPLGRQSPTGALVTFGPVYLGTKYLGFQGLNEAFNSSADSLYHAAIVSLRRRYAKGLTSTINYTYGKSMDDASDAGDVRFVNLNVRSPGQVNYGAPRSDDRSVSLFDIRHAFAASFLYDVPVGRGRTFWSHATRVVQALLGNWSVSGVGRIEGGLPMVVFLRDDNGLGVSTGNVRAIRPDIVPGVALLNPRWSRNCPIGQSCEPYFNPAAFMRPVKGTLGNAPRTFDSARGPTQQFLDLSLQKNFPIGKDGKRRLQLRLDAINLLNHPIFRIGRLEDAGEIFAAPNEGVLNTNDFNAWADFNGKGRFGTPEGNILKARSDAIVNSNQVPGRLPGTHTLRPDFFHVPAPEGFFSMNANSFDITTLQGLQLYRMRQSYTPDRWGFLDVTPGRSGYTPRFIQVALKLYF